MDLTNLIWHLAAAVAALWAGFAYRSLSSRYSELRHAVVNSMLQLHQAAGSNSSTSVFASRNRSLRVRALRWLCQEVEQERGILLQVEDAELVVGLEQEAWNRALGILLALTNPVAGNAVAEGVIDVQGQQLPIEKFSRALIQQKHQKRALKLKWNAGEFAGKGGWQCLN